MAAVQNAFDFNTGSVASHSYTPLDAWPIIDPKFIRECTHKHTMSDGEDKTLCIQLLAIMHEQGKLLSRLPKSGEALRKMLLASRFIAGPHLYRTIAYVHDTDGQWKKLRKAEQYHGFKHLQLALKRSKITNPSEDQVIRPRLMNKLTLRPNAISQLQCIALEDDISPAIRAKIKQAIFLSDQIHACFDTCFFPLAVSTVKRARIHKDKFHEFLDIAREAIYVSLKSFDPLLGIHFSVHCRQWMRSGISGQLSILTSKRNTAMDCVSYESLDGENWIEREASIDGQDHTIFSTQAAGLLLNSEAISAKQKRMLEMRIIQEMSLGEIATHYNITPAAVSSGVSRALALLRDSSAAKSLFEFMR